MCTMTNMYYLKFISTRFDALMNYIESMSIGLDIVLLLDNIASKLL